VRCGRFGAHLCHRLLLADTATAPVTITVTATVSRAGANDEDRIDEISSLLAVSPDAVERWTVDVRKADKDRAKARAYDLWLDCLSLREIAEIVTKQFPSFRDVTHQTIDNWIESVKKGANAPNLTQPGALPARAPRLTWRRLWAGEYGRRISAAITIRRTCRPQNDQPIKLVEVA
jgi:hypothetical protein